MKRIGYATGLVGLLFSGCAGVFDPVTADPAPIRPTQVLRPIRDSITDTWVAAWMDPQNFSTVSVTDTVEE
jgi:hypothetical protein